jgi:hypothetical protein
LAFHESLSFGSNFALNIIRFFVLTTAVEIKQNVAPDLPILIATKHTHLFCQWMQGISAMIYSPFREEKLKL